jgi:sulfur relay (sulfurtransferase) complex TusBCD TusD component (DsrE family)
MTGCMDSRGIDDANLTERPGVSALDEIAGWTVWAEKVVTF